MSRIFIGYRGEDSAGWTGRLVDRLKERFGSESIFIDTDTIEPGADFTEALRKAVGSCDVLLAMIGPRWGTVADKTGKSRLHDPSDWVRVEIAAALARKIRVIPVLVGNPSPADSPGPPRSHSSAQSRTKLKRMNRKSFHHARNKRSYIWPQDRSAGKNSVHRSSLPDTDRRAPCQKQFRERPALRSPTRFLTQRPIVLPRQNFVYSSAAGSRTTIGTPNFWNRTFRLLEDGLPRSPVGDLNETVEGHSTKEGLVESLFLSRSAKCCFRVLLQIRQGNDVAELPFVLSQ